MRISVGFLGGYLIYEIIGTFLVGTFVMILTESATCFFSLGVYTCLYGRSLTSTSGYLRLFLIFKII